VAAAAAGAGRERGAMSLAFAAPAALWLLLLAPLFGLIGWRFGVKRRRIPASAAWLRSGMVALLAIALAQPMLATGSGAASTVFVVDASRSATGPDGADAAGWVRAALDAAGSGDRAAVVAFGAEPKLAAPAAPANALSSGWDDPTTLDPADRDYTDIERALALARALPLGGSRRIVLASDGAENVGSAREQAAQALADGVPVDVLPLPGVAEDDLRVSGAVAPSSVWQGESVSVLASVDSPAATDATVELWADGALLATQPFARAGNPYFPAVIIWRSR